MKDRRKQRKRVLVLQLKGSKIERAYTSSFQLVAENGKNVLGVGRGAIMNAISRNNGVFENDKCKIYYRPIEQKRWTKWM